MRMGTSHSSKLSVLYKFRRKMEKVKAQAGAKVEHPFRVFERQFHCLNTTSIAWPKYGATDHAVFSIEVMNGAPTIVAGRRRSAPVRA